MIIHAISRKNGITFYSTKLPIVGTKVYYDESGQIDSETILTNTYNFIHKLEILKDSSYLHVNIFSKVAFITTIFLFSFFTFKLTNNFGFLIAGFHFCCFGACNFLELIKIIIYNKKNDRNNFSAAKFHGAEHMAIQAYNTLNRLPTMDEIKKFSRFDKYCGSQKKLSELFITIVSCFIIILITYLGMFCDNSTVILYATISIILLSVLTVFYKKLVFLQVFTTSKPTDKELYLAIEGINQFILLEENLEDKEFVKALQKISDSLDEVIDKQHKEIFGK